MAQAGRAKTDPESLSTFDTDVARSAGDRVKEFRSLTHVLRSELQKAQLLSTASPDEDVPSEEQFAELAGATVLPPVP